MSDAPTTPKSFQEIILRLQAYLLDRKVTLRMISGNLFVISKDSVRIAEAPDHGHIGSDYAAAPYVKAVLATGKPVFRAQVGRYSGRPGVLIAVPLFAWRDLYATSAVYVVLLGLSIDGLIQWRRAAAVGTAPA